MKTTLTNAELETIHKEAISRVTVSCCEYHAHTALGGCLSGEDPRDVLICQLVEALKRERRVIQEALSKLVDGV